MNVVNRILILRLSLISFIISFWNLCATADDQFYVVPTGRIFIDGATFISPLKNIFTDGVAIPEIWLGAQMNYKNWKGVINIAYNNNKVGLRAIYLGYNFKNDLLIRFGSFVPQYGLRTTLAASNLAPMISPLSNSVFNDGRQLGGMLVYYPENYLVTLSLHTEGDAATNIVGSKNFIKEGIGASSRLAIRPFHQTGKVLQLGISTGFSTPRKHRDSSGKDIHDAFHLKTNFPARVIQVSALDATIDHAVNKWKFSPEILLNYNNFALESQYYFSKVNRVDNFPDFYAKGMYVIFRSLLRGNSYSYSQYAGVLDSPNPKSLELVFDYDYTDLSDIKSGILGGQANNMSLTLNYYFNKYVIARLRYGYTHTWNRINESPVSLNSLMARLQVIF